MAGTPSLSLSDGSRGGVLRAAKRAVDQASPRNLALAMERISELEECIEQLTAHLTGRALVRLPPNFGFTPQQEVILTMLLTRPLVTRDQLMAGVYGFDDDAPDPKIMDVQICKMRSRLEELGAEVQTSWGRGWYFSSDDKARLRDVIVFFGGTIDAH